MPFMAGLPAGLLMVYVSMLDCICEMDVGAKAILITGSGLVGDTTVAHVTLSAALAPAAVTLNKLMKLLLLLT